MCLRTHLRLKCRGSIVPLFVIFFAGVSQVRIHTNIWTLGSNLFFPPIILNFKVFLLTSFSGTLICITWHGGVLEFVEEGYDYILYLFINFACLCSRIILSILSDWLSYCTFFACAPCRNTQNKLQRSRLWRRSMEVCSDLLSCFYRLMGPALCGTEQQFTPRPVLHIFRRDPAFWLALVIKSQTTAGQTLFQSFIQ